MLSVNVSSKHLKCFHKITGKDNCLWGQIVSNILFLPRSFLAAAIFIIVIAFCLLLTSVTFLRLSDKTSFLKLTNERLVAAEPPYKVPNIVHYTWYAAPDVPMKFKHYIGVLSAHKVIQPDKIIIHMNVTQPPGKYFQKIRALPTVVALNDGNPDTLLGVKLITSKPMLSTDYSDISRIKYLLQDGGIYLDYDVLVIRSFNDLRKYDCTMGQEMDDLLCGGVIVCSKSSPFLQLWTSAFVADYRPDKWAYNSGLQPTRLWRRYPNLLHVEPTKINRPNWTPAGMNKIWGNKTFDWRQNYALHTWYRFRAKKCPWYRSHYGDLHPEESDVRTMNNTFGEVTRYILDM